MKSLLLTVTPEILANILNGKASVLVRKLFPKDYVGWVYLYCSKSNDDLWCLNQGAKNQTFKLYKDITSKDNDLFEEEWTCNNKLNGKVVAKFWCDKVENINYVFQRYCFGDWSEEYLQEKSCLTAEQLHNYLKAKANARNVGYTIHISKLEIFDTPKELKHFYYNKLFHRSEPDEDGRKTFKALIQLNKAPTNYCYIEGE